MAQRQGSICVYFGQDSLYLRQIQKTTEKVSEIAGKEVSLSRVVKFLISRSLTDPPETLAQEMAEMNGNGGL